jgi:hypothetical protein
VNASTSFHMHFMNELLDHRPIIIIVNSGTPPRYIAIAAPDHIECIPTLYFWIRRFALPKGYYGVSEGGFDGLARDMYGFVVDTNC